MTMEASTRWNGEPVHAERVTVVVLDDNTFENYWARTEGIIGKEIPAVIVTYDGGKFCLDNRNDEGWDKLISGGSPNVGHKELSAWKIVTRGR